MLWLIQQHFHQLFLLWQSLWALLPNTRHWEALWNVTGIALSLCKALDRPVFKLWWAVLCSLRLAGFPPYEEIASFLFLMKSSSLHPCNKCGLYQESMLTVGEVFHICCAVWFGIRLTKVCRWENIFLTGSLCRQDSSLCLLSTQTGSKLLIILEAAYWTMYHHHSRTNTSPTRHKCNGKTLTGSDVSTRKWEVMPHCLCCSTDRFLHEPVLPAQFLTLLSKVREPLCESASFLHDVWTSGPRLQRII